MRLIKLIFLIIFIFPIRLFSQSQITGLVKNNNEKLIEFVEVQLKNKDSIIVKNELTNSKGKFIVLCEKGEYILSIKQFGNILSKQKISVNQESVDVGTIYISENKTKLAEVIVTSKKKIIERKIDRLIFNVENSISAIGGDALDVLKVTPTLLLQENSISIAGKSSVNVMVNDRIIQLSGDELINMIKSIPSDNISKIEVITTPPAKYDANGNSGLVNIVLKRAKNDSFNGNVKTSYTQAKYDTKNFGGGINYQKDKLTVISNVDFSVGIISPLQKYDIYYPNFNWKEVYNTKNQREINSQRIAIDYKILKNTIIGFEYNRITNFSKIKAKNESKIISNQLDSSIVSSSMKRINRNTNSINFHSVSTLDTIGKVLSFDFDYFKYDYSINNDFNIITYLPNQQPIDNRTFFQNNDGKQNINIYSSKVDFTLPLKSIQFSMGAKFAITTNENKILFYDILSNQYFLNNSKSNDFKYSENNNSIYFIADKELSKKWSVQFGLRFENSKTTTNSVGLNENINNYNQLFPSFYLIYKTDKESQYSFNYSRRVERPAYNLLNPFRVYSTNSNYTAGNPFLNPYFSNNFNFSFSKNNISHMLYLDLVNNGIDQVTYVNTLENNQITIPSNFFKSMIIGFSESYSFQKLKSWQSNNNFSVYYSETKSNLKETLPLINGWTAYISSFNSFTLNNSKSLKGELNFNYQSSSVSNSYKASSFYTFDTGIKYTFLKNKFQVSLNITDIFKTSETIFSNNINNIKQEKFNYADTQKFRIAISYKFGKSIKENKRGSSIDEEKNRIK